ncbi:MAG: acyl-CoA dehydrogenase family protein [Candidatus Hydrogenedentes bacterium]|nr:acyl-CoA dehydrogenase family protein [Candidatus Hydrogenedentota bacterium]
MENDNKAKQKAMDLAEDARQTEWKFPSFTAELFRGAFRWDLMHPYPVQDPEDKKIGDEYLDKLRGVLKNHCDPIKIDKTGVYPKETLRALAEAGAFGMKIPKEYGGLGLSQTNYSRALSLIGSYCQSTVTWVSAHQSIGVPQPLKMYGTKEQKQKYLPRLAKGDISAFALTEPDVGSDPAKMSTTATPSEDGSYYLLNGDKLWCTNGPDADVLVVMAKTPPVVVNGKERTQITAFIVEKEMPGFEIVQRCSFMGLKGLSNGLLRFTNVRVPKENVIGKPGEGLRIALATLNTGRLGIPAASTACGKLSLQYAEKWVNERVQWGVPIGKHQAIAKKIANMAADTFAMDAIVWIACAFADKENADIRLEAAIAKYFCTETAWRLLDDYLQVSGGRGYETAESLAIRGDDPVPVERMLRDSRVARIFEGSSEIMHLIIAREALDTHFKLVMPIMMPPKGAKESKFSLIKKAAAFYLTWYPKQWLPSGQSFNVKHLSTTNQDHLAYVDRTCRKMARTIFHQMAKLQKKMEYEQILLGNFVDIGVDLFAMSACLAYAESFLAKDSANQGPQELADLFCKNARVRIGENFRRVKDNHNKTFNKVAKSLMEGKYRWLLTDIYQDFPEGYAPGDYVPADHENAAVK